MKNPRFVNDQIYHIYNRGIEKRKIFLDDEDYFRFVHDLFEFNDTEPALNLYYKLPNLKSYKMRPYKTHKAKIEMRPRKLLVELLAFCLMPNHPHLLVKQRVDGGITEFMHKLGTGYTGYFNKKYARVGPLFQGTFKAVPITEESHFIHLLFYIHLNPLDLVMPEWRERKIKDYKKAMNFLENYRWSSFQDYIGKKNFPSITQRDLLLKFFGGPEQYKKDILQWLKDLNLENLREITLE